MEPITNQHEIMKARTMNEGVNRRVVYQPFTDGEVKEALVPILDCYIDCLIDQLDELIELNRSSDLRVAINQVAILWWVINAREIPAEQCS